mmetsp:Transcript_10165/g.30136  ORF Transcript_10165/g.30136 Transcript_10165/m.30136 type:complete len:1222 (+) Transcript_10165:89-3754(+)
MDWTWSAGLDERRRQKRGKQKDNEANLARTLPNIHQGGSSPSSPDTLGRHGSSLRLQASASEPSLSPQERERATRRAEKCAQRLAEFIERNSVVSDTHARRAKFQKTLQEVAAATHAEHEALNIGTRGIKGLRLFFKIRFGTVYYGWRAFDPEKKGKLSFSDFSRQCRLHGHNCNLKLLWDQLDQTRTGSITLADVDPKVAQGVEGLKAKLAEKHGSVLAGWRKELDPSGEGKVDETRMTAAAAAVGLEVGGAEVFGMLCREGNESVSLIDFDPDAYVKYLTFAKEVKDPEASMRAPKPDVGFRLALMQRFGTMKAAWDEALDVQQKGRVSFGEFAYQFRAQCLGGGNMQAIWKALDRDNKGHLVLEDLCKKTHALVDEFRAKFEAEHGNMLLAWTHGVDPKGTNHVSEEEFKEACGKVGFQGDVAALWRQLLPVVALAEHNNQPPGRLHMELRDFDLPSFNALNRGDFRMIGAADEAERDKNNTSTLEMSFEERNNSWSGLKLRAVNETAKSKEFAKLCGIRKARVEQKDATEEFEPLCRRVYGSIIGAWKRCLDPDQVGRLTFLQFCAGLRRLGYGKEYRSLWRRLGLEDGGLVTLKDLDPKADGLVSSFVQLLDGKFPDLDKAWKRGFGKDPVGTLTAEEFKEKVTAMGYASDPLKLWPCLLPDPHATKLSIWDVDAKASQRKIRGEVPYFLTKPQPRPVALDETTNSGAEGPTSPTAKKEARDVEIGHREISMLRQQLRSHYGSTVNAWRQIDPSWRGFIGWGKFMMVLQDCSFHNGNVKAAWKSLAGDTDPPKATFRDIDKGAWVLLDQLRQSFLGSHPDLRAAWKQHFGAADPTCEVWTQALVKAGLTEEKAQKAYKALLTYGGQHKLTFGDLTPLLWGVAPEDREATWGGGAGTGESHPKSPAGAPGGAPASPGSLSGSLLFASSVLGSTGGELAGTSKRDLVASTLVAHHSRDKVITTVKGLKNLLKNQHGSLYAAWRLGLDLDKNDVVTRSDFCNAMREIGLKAAASFWKELDTNEDGRLSLAELDPAADKAYNALEAALVEKGASASSHEDVTGHLKLGWKLAFNRDAKEPLWKPNDRGGFHTHDVNKSFCKCFKNVCACGNSRRPDEELCTQCVTKHTIHKPSEDLNRPLICVCANQIPLVKEARFAEVWAQLGLPGSGEEAYRLLRGQAQHLLFEDLWPAGLPCAPLGQKFPLLPASPKNAKSPRSAPE